MSSSLCARIDELAAADLTAVSDALLGEELVKLHATAARLSAQILRRVRAFDVRGGGDADGAVSTATWLRWKVKLVPREACSTVRLARALDVLPNTAAALADGAITVSHAGLLARAVEDVGTGHAGDIEAMLLPLACAHDPSRLRIATAHLREAVDPDGALADANAQYGRRRLSASTTFGGMVAFDGILDPEGGATVIAAIDALRAAGRVPDDPRTAAQARADALVDLCRNALDAGLPEQAGERPHVTVVLDWATLRGEPGASGADLDWTGPITAEAARRIACDSIVTRIIVGPDGQPLDVGRATRTVSSTLRRALAVRDGGCTAPGCDRPPAWTDAHHIVHWAALGRTAPGNLTLLCRHHHRAVHEGRLEVSRAVGTARRVPP